MKKLTLPGKIAVVLGVFLVLWGFKWLIVDSGIIPEKVKNSTVTSVQSVNDIPPLRYDVNSKPSPLQPLPDSNQQSTSTSGPDFRIAMMSWNAQAGVLAAVGGTSTMKNSFMDQQGVNVHLIHQDDCNVMEQNLLTFIQDYAHGNKTSSKGYTGIVWMGDGVPSYLKSFNELVAKTVGPQYIVQVFYMSGFSFGEDKFIFEDKNPNGAKVKQDPANALKGSMIVGVERDGDWDIAMKFCQLNQIKVNCNEKTYDPDAVNWVNSDDFNKAAGSYVSKSTVTRKIVRNGKVTNKDTTITINGCVTWTPGDLTCFSGRGGVTVASTIEYNAQMPCVFLACKQWLQDNNEYVKKFILASSYGCDQVKSHTSWLQFASRVSDKVYNVSGMNAEKWFKAFKGYSYTGSDGIVNLVGGSRVASLADDAMYFGFSGETDQYNATYIAFGDLDVLTYPEIVPNYPKYEDVVDLSYMKSVWNDNKNNAQMTTASVPKFTQGETGTQKIGDANYSIEFAFGSSQINPTSYRTLDQIGRDGVVVGNSLVNVIGHTDDVGDHDKNIDLSRARAEAVMNYLNNKFKGTFVNRITTDGVGPDEPFYKDEPSKNTTPAGRQKNRRVEIVFKTR